MAAVDEPQLAALHEKADLVVADGMPLVWLAQLRNGRAEIGRVAGADLMDAVCAHSVLTGQSHYFYGGKSGVADVMREKLRHRYPGLKVVGTYSPPWRDIGPSFEFGSEIIEEIRQISETGADFIWVGLSSPKQEYWMNQAAKFLERGVCFGVGAAFDFHSGAVARAPWWMRNYGLEWLHRLVSEPRRLWFRYLVLAPRFVIGVAMEQVFRSKRRDA